MQHAYVLINCELGSERSLVSDLRRIDDVTEVHGTLGMYDVILKIESDGNNVDSLVIEKIRRLEKIRSTMTLTGSSDKTIFVPRAGAAGIEPGPNVLHAYVVIHCDQGEEYTVLRKLSKIPQVRESDVVFGFYDVICRIEAYDHHDLERIVTREIRNLGHIRTTMTLNVIPEQE